MNLTIFPLPLTPFEEYMFHDDRPAYPMAGMFRLRFSGRLNRDTFTEAIATVVQRHPFLRTTVSLKRRGRASWIDHPGWRPPIEWQATINHYGFPNATYLDLTQEPGTRFWVLDYDDGHDVVIQVHHSCSDAMGMSKVIEDLLVSYAIGQGLSSAGLSLRPLAPAGLLRRGILEPSGWRSLTGAPKQAVGLIGAWNFLRRSPIPLIGSKISFNSADPPSTFPNVWIGELNVEETQRLIATARSLNVNVNDLLVRDLFLTIGTWQRQRAIANEGEWLRFSIPMSLRSSFDEQMPMTNALSLVFLDRRGFDLENTVRLLRDIHEEMELIKRNRLQYTFILSLAMSRLLVGNLSRLTNVNKCYSTSCLSNIGTVFVQTPLPRCDGRIIAGNIVLESVDFVMPLRPHLQAAFCVYTYAGRLRISLHHDPNALTNGQSKELLTAYLQQIRQTITV